MKYVYMNHRIRDLKTKGPVIVVQGVDGQTHEANEFEIVAFGQPIGRVKFDPKGLAECETHEVRAWVEFEDDVEIIKVAKAVAKKPGKKVKVSK